MIMQGESVEMKVSELSRCKRRDGFLCLYGHQQNILHDKFIGHPCYVLCNEKARSFIASFFDDVWARDNAKCSTFAKTKDFITFPHCVDFTSRISRMYCFRGKTLRDVWMEKKDVPYWKFGRCRGRFWVRKKMRNGWKLCRLQGFTRDKLNCFAPFLFPRPTKTL